jgi:hypothetical protein
VNEPELHKADEFTKGNGGACSIAAILAAVTLICSVAGLMLILAVWPR